MIKPEAVLSLNFKGGNVAPSHKRKPLFRLTHRDVKDV